MYADAKRLATATVASAGTNYKAGDPLFITGGTLLTGIGAASAQVTTVDGSGAITGVTITALGGYTVAPTTPNTVTGGNGAGATLALTFTLYWPNAPWVVPVAADLYQVLSPQVLSKCNLSLDDLTNAVEGQPIDPSAGSTRASSLIASVVAQMRGAIMRGNRVPLSVTAGSVPPEALLPVLNIAAWQIVNSTPNLQMAIITEKGAYAPFGTLAKEGKDFMDRVARGQENVSYPSDPDTGWKSAVRVGSILETADLETEGPATLVDYDTANLGQP